jgi:hypothetical protein
MRLFLIPFLLLFPALISAQEIRQIQCRFLSFGGLENPPAVIAAAEKGAEVTCLLSSSQISEKIVCFAVGNKIQFLSTIDRKPTATATIPPGVHSALLVFVQVPGSSAAAAAPASKILVIEDSAKTFPAGGAFIANLYNKDIRFIIGEHKGMLHAGGIHGYAMPEERDSFNMAPVVFEFLQGDKWRIANESALRFLPAMRYLIFAYVDPVSGRPRINTYQDFAPPGPETALP